MGNTSTISTDLYDKQDKDSDLDTSVERKVKFKVNAHGGYANGKSQDYKFTMNALHANIQKMAHIFDKIVEYIESKQYPLKISIENVSGFIGYLPNKKAVQSEYKTLITKYSPNDINNIGLDVEFRVNFKHKIIASSITCEYMKKLNTKNPMKCSIYFAMKERAQLTQNNLNHLHAFTHFINETEQKPSCDSSVECKAYIRCTQGQSRLDDACHMKLYRHPPRARSGLSGNMHSFIFNKLPKDNKAIYDPNFDHHLQYITCEENGFIPMIDPFKSGPAIKGDPDPDNPAMFKETKWNKKDGYLEALIEEVVRNGFKYDLCLNCTKNDHCTHDKYSILTSVEEKMKCKRHKEMDMPLRSDHMLALILYTGCDCNYDFCKSQRSNDYQKWHYFDLCLYNAIGRLSERESGSFPLYSGLQDVQLDRKIVKSGFFPTYISTSWRKEIATGFIGGNDGMLIQIDPKYKDDGSVICCDVSWISKFPDECEILISRSWDRHNGFECVVIDNIVKVLPSGEKKIQIVALKKRDSINEDIEELFEEKEKQSMWSQSEMDKKQLIPCPDIQQSEMIDIADDAFSKTYTHLTDMGFDDVLSIHAANMFGDNIERCVEYIISQKQNF